MAMGALMMCWPPPSTLITPAEPPLSKVRTLPPRGSDRVSEVAYRRREWKRVIVVAQHQPPQGGVDRERHGTGRRQIDLR